MYLCSVQREPKKHTVEEAREKIFRFCAYQERAHQEVRDKLFSLGLRSGEVDELLTELIVQGFLNEERFAKAFAGGRFRLKNWGRVKIAHELQARGLTQRCIESGLKEIDDDSYEKSIEKLIDKKLELVEEENPFVLRQKIAQYLIGKGYEAELVWRIIKEKIAH